MEENNIKIPVVKTITESQKKAINEIYKKKENEWKFKNGSEIIDEILWEGIKCINKTNLLFKFSKRDIAQL